MTARLDKAYDSLHALFGRAVVVAHLMEDLITSPRAAGLAAAADRMEAARIDVIGAREDDGRVVGYFSRAGFTPFSEGDVMSATSSLRDALDALRARERVFVADAREARDGDVVGIVTRADLQKPPFRLYCFGLVTLLEMHLLQLIRAHYANDDAAALASLSEERARECRDMFHRRQKRGLDIGLADCLQIADKRDIVARTPALLAQVRFDSVRAWRRTIDDVRDIRDDLAHGQLLDGGREWTDVIARMLEIEALLTSSLRPVAR